MKYKPKMPRFPRRRPARRAKKTNRRVRRARRTNVVERASCSVARTVSQQNGNQMYDYSTFQLADYPRAVAVAKAYQYFRIKNIKITWKPQFDSYVASVGGGLLKPQLYYMINKGAGIPTNITLEGLKNLGAKPHAFDEKPISVSFSPAVLQDTQSLVGSVASSYKVSPWLITNANPDVGLWNPSNVQHNGLIWYMETPGGVQRFDLDIELQFEYKKPLIDNMVSSTPALGLVYPLLNDSPDGIVGGSDGL